MLTQFREAGLTNKTGTHIYERVIEGRQVIVHSPTCPACLRGDPAPDGDDEDFMIIQNQVVIAKINSHCGTCAKEARDSYFPGCIVATEIYRGKTTCTRKDQQS